MIRAASNKDHNRGLKAPLILASQSKSRQAMLQAAGLDFQICPPHFDEKLVLRSGAPAGEIAAKLALGKAMAISQQYPEAIVIGGDQVIECGGKILSKAKDIAAAKEKLRLLSGQSHHLISAAAVVQGQKPLWQYAGEAHLTMHDIDDEFIDHYCKRAGIEILTGCVGAYALEGLGARLFKQVEGDYFTVLGLPLLPLLNYLYEEQGLRL